MAIATPPPMPTLPPLTDLSVDYYSESIEIHRYTGSTNVHGKTVETPRVVLAGFMCTVIHPALVKEHRDEGHLKDDQVRIYSPEPVVASTPTTKPDHLHIPNGGAIMIYEVDTVENFHFHGGFYRATATLKKDTQQP